MIVSRSSVLSGGLLLIAGYFSLVGSSMHACVRVAPARLLAERLASGLVPGMGMRHGFIVLVAAGADGPAFVGGAMNLLWIAALTGLFR